MYTYYSYLCILVNEGKAMPKSITSDQDVSIYLEELMYDSVLKTSKHYIQGKKNHFYQ